MPRERITAAHVILSIEAWREQLSEILNAPDDDARMRALLHLDTAMMQVLEALSRLTRPDDQIH